MQKSLKSFETSSTSNFQKFSTPVFKTIPNFEIPSSYKDVYLNMKSR